MKITSRIVFMLMVLFGAAIITISTALFVYDNVSAAAEKLNSRLVSVYINESEYIHGVSAPIQLITDEVFTFKVTMTNTGTTTWGQKAGEHGASLLSYPDYNSTFGTFFILHGQSSQTLSGKNFTWGGTKLRAPQNAGRYVMKWRLADYPVHGNRGSGETAYNNRPFYGDIVTVDVIIVPRMEQSPAPRPRVRGVLDQHDLEYEGSFRLPDVTPLPVGYNDEKNFHPGGIAIRTVEIKPGVFEKRMIAQTSTNGEVLYECAIPELGRFVNNSGAGVPIAQLRTVFGVLSKPGGSLGTIWYDEQNDSLFWTNFNSYYTKGAPGFPVLSSASLAGGRIKRKGEWYLPDNLGDAPFKSFWGGVTVLPDGFAGLYTGGKKLALGFGGEYSINATASFGPALAAVSLGKPGEKMEVLPVMYYAGANSSSSEHCLRDGNYLALWGPSLVPPNPWTGSWTVRDVIRSGVFIDLPDKKGYIAFAQMAMGRIGYDYGGPNWFGKSYNAWYFYDFDTLGAAARGEIPKKGLTPSSYNIVEYPYDAATANGNVNTSGRDNFNHSAAGSYFEPKTRRLYLYVGESMKNNDDDNYINPVIHVYRVTD